MNIKHDKTEVVKKGLRLFCENGYNSTGVDKLCTITGMTKGAFYNAFKSKENFLLACLDMYTENNIKRISEKLSPRDELCTLDRLECFYYEMLKIQPNINYMGCLINNTMSELGGINKRIAENTTKHFETILKSIEPTVIEAQKEGSLTKKIDATELTELLHATFFGVLTRLKSSHEYQKGITTMTILINSLKK